MKRITVNSRVQILEDVQSDFSERMIPAGTMGTVVEYYENPEGYAIDLAMPDGNMTGGFVYENVILTPEQFIVIADRALSDPFLEFITREADADVTLEQIRHELSAIKGNLSDVIAEERQ